MRVPTRRFASDRAISMEIIPTLVPRRPDAVPRPMAFIALIVALCVTWPAETKKVDIVQHVLAAQQAASQYHLDPALLLAVAWHETNFQAQRISRAGACGVMQTMPSERSTCAELADVRTGYLEGAFMITAWRRAAGGDLSRGMAGYACGNAGLDRHGVCGGFSRMMLRMSADLDGKANRWAERLRRLADS